MAATPRHLLQALDMITAPAAPSARAAGRLEALHAGRIRAVFEDPNIAAIGIAQKTTERKPTGALGLVFYVERKIPKGRLPLRRYIPPVVAAPDGRAVFTDVKALGTLRPQLGKKSRPLQSGYSCGNVSITAGTLGAIVRKNRRYFLLSNAHVLAPSASSAPGESIVYPGPLDGGKLPRNRVATLAQVVPLRVGNDFLNRVDAALAAIDEDRLDELDFSVQGLKGLPAVAAPVRGMRVIKRGRTSGVTEGVVEDVNFRVVINYKGFGMVGFLDQVLCTRYSSEGDSGALVVDKATGKIVGLHFAGASGGSVFNPIRDVVAALGFKFARG